jgi:hypothetical protein
MEKQLMKILKIFIGIRLLKAINESYRFKV